MGTNRTVNGKKVRGWAAGDVERLRKGGTGEARKILARLSSGWREEWKNKREVLPSHLE